MNPNWTRWIHASLNDYVKTQLEKLNVFVHFEGQSREQLADKSDYVEFRWNGPEAREHSRGWWELDVNLNFVINSGTNRDDTYTHKVIVGKVQSILKNSINVFKLGDTESDDPNTLLGCLQLKVDARDGILTNYFGRQQDVELEQSTVEAWYCMSGTFN
jgi:hypothetical protein